MDRRFWEHYGRAIRGDAELWTVNQEAARVYRLHHIRGEMGGGVSTNPKAIRMGGNSGFQGLQLALHFGAARVVLVGYDMQNTFNKSHWHGDHKRGFGNPLDTTFKAWRQCFKEIPHDIRARVVNASRHSSLDCFRRVRLETCLSESAA
jgi:hypothetical protein